MISISVVTPSLNQARFVERTVRSVLDQAYSPLEYIVCDGGSTDGSLSVLERYADRLTFISEPDRGQADAVNKGIRRTSGEVIGWLNSDDVYAANALHCVAGFLTAHPDTDVVYGDAHLLDASDALVGAYYTEPWNQTRLPERCFLCQPAVFFRRRVIDRVGLLDERLHYSLDYEYWLRLAAGGATFAHLPLVLAGSRVHPDTKTLRDRVAVHEELNAMLRGRVGRVPDSWLINNAHTLVELRRAHNFSYALEVVLESVRLSWRWNHAVPRSLLAAAMRPVATGGRRRLAQSRSADTRRPAS